MINQQAAISDYLSKQSLENWTIELNRPGRFNNIIVVPAVQEYENTLRLLESLIANDKKYFEETLLIFVVNNLADSTAEVKADNLKLLRLLREIISSNRESEFSRRIVDSGLNIGLVDASTPGRELPPKDGGVGLARKIGMDLALKQFNYNSSVKKILICLDADCTVEQNYLTSIVEAFHENDIHTAYVQYEHSLPESDEDKRAIICYELFLRYYVLGLKYACSPFAFPTIGSTMICDDESYVRIGGMNKKKAAEDFYFMEKLAKITTIHKIDSTKIFPASRGSWRVPFGTGQRVNRFKAKTHAEYLLYDPISFEILKKWLAVFNSKENKSTLEYLGAAKEINSSLHAFLLQNKFEDSWNKILANSKSDLQIDKQKMIWFDGFRTLKLIHFLRDTEFPSVNMFDAVDQMLVTFGDEPLKKNNSFPSLDLQIKYLKKLRQLS